MFTEDHRRELEMHLMESQLQQDLASHDGQEALGNAAPWMQQLGQTGFPAQPLVKVEETIDISEDEV